MTTLQKVELSLAGMGRKMRSIAARAFSAIGVKLESLCDDRLLSIRLGRLLVQYSRRQLGPGIESLSRHELQLKYVKTFNIKEGDRVLDIGCGGDPFPMSTVVADRFPDSDQDRPSYPLETLGKPFVVCDVQALPFRDKSYDFVYCSQLLEHVPDPIIACREIQRVSLRGYIDTPYRISDVLHNYLFLHRWSVSHAGNTLVFREYQEWERKGTNDKTFEQLAVSKNNNFYRWWREKNYNFFVNRLFWEGSFRCIVILRDGSIQSYEPENLV